MSLKEKMIEQRSKIDYIYDQLKDENIKRIKKREFKLPAGIKGKMRKEVKQGRLLAIFLRSNKRVEFRIVKIIGGLVQLDKYDFNIYESDAVYTYQRGRIVFPVIVVWESRLAPVGGGVDEKITQARIMGTKLDSEDADILNITSYAQQTIIRAIEIAKAEELLKKKKGIGMVWWIIIGGVILYVIGKAFGLV